MLFRKGLIVFLSLVVSVVVVAQDDSCPAFVNVALKNVASACGELGRNEACYGNNRVDANFWQAQADMVFKAISLRNTG